MATIAAPSTTPSVPAYALIVVFLAALVAPRIDMLLRDASARGPEVEGRATRPAPPWRADARLLHRYPQLFEAHFSDALGLRDHMLRLYSRRCLEIFGTSPSADIRIGRDGWLFYAGEKSFEVHRGLLPFTPAQLAAWQKAIEARRDFTASIGAVYMFVIGPNKEEIYPDYLPDGLEPLGPTRLAQLVDWMDAHSDVEILDLRPSLRAARAKDGARSYLYFEEGTHWNGRGCMVAVQEIERAASVHFPELKDAPRPEWHIQPDALPETWRKKMYLTTPPHLARDNWVARPRELRAIIEAESSDLRVRNFAIPGADLPSILMFHDSFGPVVIWLLSERFATARSRSNLFDTAELIQNPPDLVVELFVERALVSLQPQLMQPKVPRAIVALNADRGHEAQQRRFDASLDVRLGVDLQRAPSEFQTSGQLGLDTVNDASGGGLALTRTSAFDSLILPPTSSGAQSDLLLLVEIDSPVASSADLLFQSAGRDDWPADQRVVIPLAAGKNRHWVPLHQSYRVERMRLRPGAIDGERCVLRHFEARAVARP